jgi:DNA-binding LacI/PurR family transcriptional regulator
LTEPWFAEHGCADPVRAAQQWQEWLARRRDWLASHPERSAEAKYRKGLQLATGLSEAAIRHYLKGRSRKLSPAMLNTLDALSRALGQPLPARRQPPKGQPSRPRGARRIALLTSLTDLPSPSFHLAVLRGVARAAAQHHFDTALHEVSPARLGADVERVVRVFRPDAVLMIRLNPSAEALQVLTRAQVPTVLLHADGLPEEYPSPPVLANIVPAQRPIVEGLKRWALSLPGRGKVRNRSDRRREGAIVVVALPPDQDRPFSIRKERIDLILEALAEFQPVLAPVEDYTFRHALKVFRDYPDAQAYICLSDEIAVALRHLLVAAGKEFTCRIIGFDDSELARKEHITSFGQHLPEIGEAAVAQLSDWLTHASAGAVSWPAFQVVKTEVYLALRD